MTDLYCTSKLLGLCTRMQTINRATRCRIGCLLAKAGEPLPLFSLLLLLLLLQLDKGQARLGRTTTASSILIGFNSPGIPRTHCFGAHAEGRGCSRTSQKRWRICSIPSWNNGGDQSFPSSSSYPGSSPPPGPLDEQTIVSYGGGRGGVLER